MTIEDSNIDQQARDTAEHRPGAVDRRIVVMGVCASGKTTFGKLLAERRGAEFIDGDDLHPERNVRKMSAGEPLDDDDRAPWLAAVRDALANFRAGKRDAVIACSALRKTYRDLLRAGDPDLLFVFLDIDKPLIIQRINDREGHFMKAGMVESQFATLERPDTEPGTITIAGNRVVEAMVEDCLAALANAGRESRR